MNPATAWRDELLLVIEIATTALRGAPNLTKLFAAISALEYRVQQLKKHHYDVAAVRDAIQTHLLKQPGCRHDHFDQELDGLCEDWLRCNPNSFIYSNTATREAVSRELAAYKRRYPFKPAPPA